MATVVQSISFENSSNSQALTLHGVGQGHAILAVASNTATGGTDCTFTGASFSRLVTQSQSNFQLQQWLSLNLAANDYTITVTTPGSNTSLALLEISGLANTGQPDTTNNSGGNPPQFGPLQPGSVTPASGTELAITACCLYIPAGTGNLSVDSGYMVQENVVNGYLAVAWKNVSAATNPSWSVGGGEYVYADIVLFKNAAVTAGPNLRMMMGMGT